MIKEYELLKSLDHPHILRLLEVFRDEENFLLVTELCDGVDMIDEMETR
jgi:serine/threonine protein kinase